MSLSKLSFELTSSFWCLFWLSYMKSMNIFLDQCGETTLGSILVLLTVEELRMIKIDASIGCTMFSLLDLDSIIWPRSSIPPCNSTIGGALVNKPALDK